MNEQRKHELMREFAGDMRNYLKELGFKQDFIDSTCSTAEEVEFMESVAWWVEVEE